MKRLVALLLCVISTILVYAQDIIVTHNSERINALIIEVSETEVRYREVNNPDGPVFVISTSNIASILFKNGDVQTFVQQKEAGNSKKGVMISAYRTVSASEDLKFIPGQQIVRRHSNSYYYGNYEMNDAVFREFIKNNCPDAYRQYKTGYNLKLGGGITGFALGLGCAISFGIAGAKSMNDDTKVKCLISGSAFAVAGVTSFLTCYFVGKKKQATAYQTFNSQCAQSQNYTSDVSLDVGVTGNGIGLALNF